VPFLRLSQDAQPEFRRWLSALEVRLRTRDCQHEVIHAHLSKFRGLCPKLALLFHVIDCADRGSGGPVSLAAVRLGMRWCAFLEAHARRIYGAVLCPQEPETYKLATRIERGDLRDGFCSQAVKRSVARSIAWSIWAGYACGFKRRTGGTPPSTSFTPSSERGRMQRLTEPTEGSIKARQRRSVQHVDPCESGRHWADSRPTEGRHGATSDPFVELLSGRCRRFSDERSQSVFLSRRRPCTGLLSVLSVPSCFCCIRPG
jgi:hypothetical protein